MFNVDVDGELRNAENFKSFPESWQSEILTFQFSFSCTMYNDKLLGGQVFPN